MFWLVIGCILEVVGYVQIHSGSSSQSASIIIAPIFLSASVYVCFSRLANHFQACDLCLLNPTFLAIFFFIGDVSCLALQVLGIVFQFMNGKETAGRVITIVGFVAQIVLFIFFSWNVIMLRRNLGRRVPQVHVDARLQWPSFFPLILTVSLLFFIRNVFRLVEYGQGFGYIFYHAIFTYIFDGVPMFLVCLLLLCFHPFLWMDRNANTRRKEKKEAVFGKKNDNSEAAGY